MEQDSFSIYIQIFYSPLIGWESMLERAVRNLNFSFVDAADVAVMASFPIIWPKILVGLVWIGAVEPDERGHENFIMDVPLKANDTHLSGLISKSKSWSWLSMICTSSWCSYTAKKELSWWLTVCYFGFRWVNKNHYYVEDNYMSIFSSFSVNFPPHFIPSCQLTVSMHQIGSLICNQHSKLMVKMTILFLLCTDRDEWIKDRSSTKAFTLIVLLAMDKFLPRGFPPLSFQKVLLSSTLMKGVYIWMKGWEELKHSV